MRASITVDINEDGAASGASFVVYGHDGRVLVSERSSGRNVAKRLPAETFDRLLDQALKVLNDVDFPGDENEDY